MDQEGAATLMADRQRKPVNKYKLWGEERTILRKILIDIPTLRIEQDLEKYKSRAIEMGASDAVIIPSQDIVIDERVRAKCIYPKCNQYGLSLNCPPHAPDLDFVRKVVQNFHYAILFCVKDKTGDFIGAQFRNRPGREKPNKVLLNEICSEIESIAFYEGYYFSIAFGQGPCKTFWCPDKPCEALQRGKGCRFPLKARSSMEAVGMDVFSMAAKQGWEIYPCGGRTTEEDIPHILLVGLILIC